MSDSKLNFQAFHVVILNLDLQDLMLRRSLFLSVCGANVKVSSYSLFCQSVKLTLILVQAFKL